MGDSGGRGVFLSCRGHDVQDMHFFASAQVGCTELKLERVDIQRAQTNALTMESMDKKALGACS